MNWASIASIVVGFAVARLADALLGIDELADSIASTVHELLARPPWLAAGGA